MPPSYSPLVLRTFWLCLKACAGSQRISLNYSDNCILLITVFIPSLRSKLDYCGIAILTMGSFVPWLYYGFYCQFFAKMFYLVAILLLGNTISLIRLTLYSNRACLLAWSGRSCVIYPLSWSLTISIVICYRNCRHCGFAVGQVLGSCLSQFARRFVNWQVAAHCHTSNWSV